jgi:hypothetical protein
MKKLYGKKLYGLAAFIMAALLVACEADNIMIPEKKTIPKITLSESTPDTITGGKRCGGWSISATDMFNGCDSLVIDTSPIPDSAPGSIPPIRFSMPVTKVMVEASYYHSYGCYDDRFVPTTCMTQVPSDGRAIAYDSAGVEVDIARLDGEFLYSRGGISSIVVKPGLIVVEGNIVPENIFYDFKFEIHDFGPRDTAEVEPDTVVTDTLAIKIKSVKTPNAGSSFTTKENKIELEAEVISVSPGNETPEITWIIEDDPNDEVASMPPGTPLKGLKTVFNVPTHSTARWKGFRHKGLLKQKSLSYVIKAKATRGGKTVESEEVQVTQNEMDTMRQEYIDFGFPMPASSSVRRAGDPGFSSALFGQLNQGDYSVAFLSEVLPTIIATLMAVIPNSVEHINSGFRNPVHHQYHISAKPKTNKTPHAQGNGLDLSVGRNKDVWEIAKIQAIKLGLCIEPLEKSTLSHIHVDWRGGRRYCPINW